MSSQAGNTDIERLFEEAWSKSWYARYRCARRNFAGTWMGPCVPVEIVGLWKRRDWLDLLLGTGGVPAANTYRVIIEALKTMPEFEKEITGHLCGSVPMEDMPLRDRPDGPYWGATRACNVLHKDVLDFESQTVKDRTLSGLYVGPYATAPGSGADTLKDEPPVTIVPVPEEQ
ncbi:uncharacterized protein B0T23DRAFT_400123 [Neurospora hispaniola]|uniref:Uncharacterized protein n=1 Tax=Neurospora hispaniola TaxID=588809 RepID=A0AAJ0MM31_9PEZI|nr:hypothetical protein B0T23DRAFT_400123 [Neurospora hispaniola]